MCRSRNTTLKLNLDMAVCAHGYHSSCTDNTACRPGYHTGCIISTAWVHRYHEDDMTLEYFLLYWLFVGEIHQSPVDSTHKGTVRGVGVGGGGGDYISFVVTLIKLLGKELSCRWFEMLWRFHYHHDLSCVHRYTSRASFTYNSTDVHGYFEQLAPNQLYLHWTDPFKKPFAIS